jgi:hypothetical protein
MPGFITYDFYLYDAIDPTKELHFSLSSLQANTSNTLVIPAGYSSTNLLTLPALEQSQTFTAINTFQRLTDGQAIRIAQSAAGQTEPLVWVKSAGSGKLLVINRRGNLAADSFAICDGDGFGISGAGDDTKRLFHNLAGITTATDRTWTAPDVSGEVLLAESVLCYDGDVLTYDDEVLTL